MGAKVQVPNTPNMSPPPPPILGGGADIAVALGRNLKEIRRVDQHQPAKGDE